MEPAPLLLGTDGLQSLVDVLGERGMEVFGPQVRRGVIAVGPLSSVAELPAGWLIYITVADVKTSAAACAANGGEVLVEPRGLAGGQFCVIRDPSGATAALYQP